MGDLHAELTELLRDMRHEAGLSRSQLAQRLGWDPRVQGSVSHYELGHRIPEPELIGRWAAACGYTAELHVYSDAGSVWVVELNGHPHG